ncbi:MAG: crosslink repair DNA glycosylase YcaQ family protein [Actinomycetota bacterium]|nr:crosslink repair DNA glycosylase YcaQ family protein [Actinomycetota bacterium]
MAARPIEVSEQEARSIASAAQGLGPLNAATRPDRRHLRKAFRNMGVLQIDAVSAVARSHLLVLRSRVGGSHDDLSCLLERSAYKHRELAEYWGHEASYLPIQDWPLFRWRMRRAERGELWKGIRTFAAENSGFISKVERQVAAAGPVSAGQLQKRGRGSSWWGWSESKIALEWLFWIGRLSVSKRDNFTRYYDLSERVLPPSVFEHVPAENDAHLELLRRAAHHLGVASSEDLVDYHRLPKKEGKERVKELVENKELVSVEVQGWDRPAYMAADAKSGHVVSRSMLLSPFDPVVWFRPRAARLFGFEYRLEIYVPAEKRVHGYYVMPFLYENNLCARVDVRAELKTKVLHVPGAYVESEGLSDHGVEALADELRSLAIWRGLEHVRVGQRGNLARRLRRALRAA